MLGHPVQVCRRVTSCSAGICIQLAAVPLRSNPHSKYIQGPLQAPATAYRRPAARHSSTTVCRVTPSPTPPSSKLKRSIWTAVDVAALLGSVGGALAALLGVVSPTYALTLPLVLPVVSLIAALQREDLSNEVGTRHEVNTGGCKAVELQLLLAFRATHNLQTCMVQLHHTLPSWLDSMHNAAHAVTAALQAV